MKTIMLACAQGMSTSLLVTKMKEAALNKGIETDIFANPTTQIDDALKEKDVDVLLLGPQVRFMEADLKEKLSGKNIPVAAIDMRYYGMMDGEKVLEEALKIIDKEN